MAIEIKPQPYLPAVKSIEPEKDQRITPEQAKELAIATAASGAIGYGIYKGLDTAKNTIVDGAKQAKDKVIDNVNYIKNTDAYKNEIQPRINQIEATIDSTDPRHDLAMKNWKDEKDLVTNYWGQKIDNFNQTYNPDNLIIKPVKEKIDNFNQTYNPDNLIIGPVKEKIDNIKRAIEQHDKTVDQQFIKNVEEPIKNAYSPENLYNAYIKAPFIDPIKTSYSSENNGFTNYLGTPFKAPMDLIDKIKPKQPDEIPPQVYKTLIGESTEKIKFNIKKPSFLEEGIVDTIKNIPSKIANADLNKGRDYIKNNFGLLAGGLTLGTALGLGVHNNAVSQNLNNPISVGVLSGTIGAAAGAFAGQKIHEYVKKNNEQSNDDFNYRY